jgi:predicted nucleic acid-binding Zn ribbon protein
MPIYEYVVIREDGSEGEPFEIIQGINDAPLTVHPETGAPVRRIISRMAPPKVLGGTSQSKPDLSNSNLERLGFTKYQKTRTGKYEKVAGEGPSQIQRQE